MAAKSTADRVAKLRASRKALGLVRREYYATPEEHTKLGASLKRLRGRSK